jgi:hypothetical protein
MRFLIPLIHFILLACSSRPATPGIGQLTASPEVKVLRVYRSEQKLTIQMEADDRVLDGNGVTVGHFDATSRVVTVGDVKIPLDEVVRARDDGGVTLELPIGTWRLKVSSDGGLSLNGEHWGRLEGFDATQQAWIRLEALFASLPVMPITSRSGEPLP